MEGTGARPAMLMLYGRAGYAPAPEPERNTILVALLIRRIVLTLQRFFADFLGTSQIGTFGSIDRCPSLARSTLNLGVGRR